MSFDNDLIITAMDRFVWFVIFVVMTHLVTEMTRVTGGPPSQIQPEDINIKNDSLLVTALPVQSFILDQDKIHAHVFLKHPDDQIKEKNHDNNNANSNNTNHNNHRNNSNRHNANNNNNNINTKSSTITMIDSVESRTRRSLWPWTSLLLSPSFDFSPLMENIFELPMITFLNAANNLIGPSGRYALKDILIEHGKRSRRSKHLEGTTPLTSTTITLSTPIRKRPPVTSRLSPSQPSPTSTKIKLGDDKSALPQQTLKLLQKSA